LIAAQAARQRLHPLAFALIDIGRVRQSPVGLEVALARLAEALEEGAIVAIGDAPPGVSAEQMRLLCHSVVGEPIGEVELGNSVRAACVIADVSQEETPRAAEAACRILLAEDNEINRHVIARTLERAGHHVAVVENGPAALREITRCDYDLCIVDMQMPGLSGLEVYERYLADGALRTGIPFVVLTATATTELRAACRALGVGAYLIKPVAADQLLRTVARLTGGAPMQAGAEARWSAVQPEEPLIEYEVIESWLTLERGPEVLVGLAREMESAMRDVLAALAPPAQPEDGPSETERREPSEQLEAACRGARSIALSLGLTRLRHALGALASGSIASSPALRDELRSELERRWSETSRELGARLAFRDDATPSSSPSARTVDAD
jgi:CheY-like chemotaxis protein